LQVASDISGVVNSWPAIPPSLTSVLDDILKTTGITEYPKKAVGEGKIEKEEKEEKEMEKSLLY
jgi:hypothetical protein